MSTAVAATTSGLEVRPEALSASGLVRDLLAGDARLAAFYAGHPLDPAAYARKAEEVAKRLDPDARRRIAPAVRATTAAAAEKWERILRGDGAVVTTGQQAGLFGGPLYTVNKALSAIRLAEALEADLGMPVAPLFWVASDDHDWHEVDHAHVLDAGNALHRIALAADPAAPQVPVSDRILGPEAEDAVAALEAVLPSSEFAGPIVDLVRSAYRPGVSMAAAFEALLAGLFAGFDLLLVDPAHEAVKRAAAPVLARELERTAAHAALLARTSERLRAAGYEPQVPISDDASNVFFHDDAGRERLVRDADRWHLRRTKRVLSDDDIVALLDAEPTRFSPNVLLRPVVESAIFPTLCYVGGPSEVAYFAQIGCLFREHAIDPPVVFPRFSITLIEGKVRKVLDKFELDAAEFRRPFHELATQRVREEMPPAVTEPLGRLRQALRAEYEAVREAAAAIDPTLRKWIDGVRNAGLGETDNVEKKIASHLKKRSEVELEQLRKASINLFPENVPQERLLNVLPYLARYGNGVLHDVARAMQVRLVPDGTAGWTGVRCDG